MATILGETLYAKTSRFSLMKAGANRWRLIDRKEQSAKDVDIRQAREVYRMAQNDKAGRVYGPKPCTPKTRSIWPKGTLYRVNVNPDAIERTGYQYK